MKGTILTRRNFAKPSASFVPRFKNPFVAGVGYTSESVLYDTFSVAAAAAMPGTTVMFQTPIGGAKTLAMTNIRAAGMLENGDVFRVKAFGIMVAFNTYSADAINLLENCSVTLTIGGRVFLEGKISLFPGGRGGYLTAASQVGTAPAGNNIQIGFSNGVPELRNMFTFSEPIDITTMEQVRVEIKAETGFSMAAAAVGGNGTTITAIMEGFRTRKAQ